MSSKRIKELEAKLRPDQVKAARMLVDNEFRDEIEGKKLTQDEIAKECGTTRMTLFRWRQDPVFNEYQQLLGKNELGTYHSEVLGILIQELRKTRSRHWIELFGKFEGMMVTKQIIENVDTNPQSDEQIKQDLEDLDRLLETEVEEPKED